MGKVAEPKKTKKKGRPSLLDLQKRTLKQQQQLASPKSGTLNSSPNPNHPSPRQNPNLEGVSPAEGLIDGEDYEDEDERKEKKLKPLFGLPSHNHHCPRSTANSLSLNSVPYGSDSNAYGEDPEACNKKRKIDAVRDGSAHSTAQKGEKVLKATDTLQGSRVESGPTTPLPDRKLLVFILDRLQKKDTHGVFSEPVDPKELPDYHDIIDHPMDFGTVRKKLDGGLYSYLDQFEGDVFLICSNAMQYNAPDTIYFRQARSIQELAKKDFENLRQDSDDSEPQPKVVRRGRPPRKNLTTSFGPSSIERLGPEFSSDATLATAGDNALSSNSYNLMKGPTSYKFRPEDVLIRASHRLRNSETYIDWSSEWNNEFPVSILKGVSTKYGKKLFSADENRRDTYRLPLSSGHEPSVLTILEGEKKQLMAVGLHWEHVYARSLARFAADLGPVIWKIASKKIENVLPIGLNFGPGWVGEKEMSQQQPFSLSEKQKFVNNSAFDDNPSRHLTQFTCGLNSIVSSRSFRCKEEIVESAKGLNTQSDTTLLNSSVGGIKIHPALNGFSAEFGCNISSQMGIARLAAATENSSLGEASVPSQMLTMLSNSCTTSIYPVPANHYDSNDPKSTESSSRLHYRNALAPDRSLELHTAAPEVRQSRKHSWQGFVPHHKQDFLSVPPDLNVRFQSPGSPAYSVLIATPQQPDLALQL